MQVPRSLNPFPISRGDCDVTWRNNFPVETTVKIASCIFFAELGLAHIDEVESQEKITNGCNIAKGPLGKFLISHLGLEKGSHAIDLALAMAGTRKMDDDSWAI